MSIRAIARGPGTALRVMAVEPAELGLEEQLFGLLLGVTACLRLPHSWGLVQHLRSPVAQMNEATVNYLK